MSGPMSVLISNRISIRYAKEGMSIQVVSCTKHCVEFFCVELCEPKFCDCNGIFLRFVGKLALKNAILVIIGWLSIKQFECNVGNEERGNYSFLYKPMPIENIGIVIYFGIKNVSVLESASVWDYFLKLKQTFSLGLTLSVIGIVILVDHWSERMTAGTFWITKLYNSFVSFSKALLKEICWTLFAFDPIIIP